MRGEPEWTPDGLQFFNSLSSGTNYFNPVSKVSTNLDQDLDSGVGVEPWFRHYFKTMGEHGIARQK